MIKKISLRWRLTLFTSILIAVCCIGLSIVLNASAYRMADTIDASEIRPAYSVGTPTDMVPLAPFPSAEAAQTVLQAKHGYLMESLVYTVIAVLAGGILTYYISGKALEPIRTLNEQVKNINSHNLSESLDIPPSKDELAELTASFNEMTDKLARSFAAQKRFSADAAHELRTPLAVLQTKLDVFCKRKQHSQEEYEALTAAFQKQIKRLRSLVTELLEIADMEHELQRKEVSLEMLMEDVVNELTPLAEEKNIALKLNHSDLYVSGDYALLYRAFYNLTENAIKYNVAHGSVIIGTAVKNRNCVAVTVKDTGIGIPEPMKKQIFEPFYRVDKSRSREMGGAGLGLSLVEAIIKKHDGIVSVDDNGESGSCFTVTLPIKSEMS